MVIQKTVYVPDAAARILARAPDVLIFLRVDEEHGGKRKERGLSAAPSWRRWAAASAATVVVIAALVSD
ncbi:MAG: hypothetical protein EON59_17930, partial [Alphaproteobacteria bacterium]